MERSVCITVTRLMYYIYEVLTRKELKKAYVAGFIGKLAKMAAGVKQTHVKGGKVDMKFLSELAKRCDAKSVKRSLKQKSTSTP